MRLRITALCTAIALSGLAFLPGAASAQAKAPAAPDVQCPAAVRVVLCEATLHNAATGLNLGINPAGTVIVNTPNTNTTQLWNVLGPVNGSSHLFVIFSVAQPNMALAHDQGCMSAPNNAKYPHCATLSPLPDGQHATEDQEWYINLASGKYSFEGTGTQRGLDDPCGCAGSAGQQAVLFHWDTSDKAQQWTVPPSSVVNPPN